MEEQPSIFMKQKGDGLRLNQYCISTGILVYTWGKLHDENEYLFKITPDGKYIFSKDPNGVVKQWCILTKFCKDWGRCAKSKIYHFNISDDSKFLFTTGTGRIIKQWCIRTGKLVNDWGQIINKAINDTAGLIIFPKKKS